MVIEVHGISRAFGDKKAVSEVSATFYPGKTNLVIGASGSGKTVLMKCMVGLIVPDKGNVVYDGYNFTQGSLERQRVIRRIVGMLFQGLAIFDSKNVEQNVMFPLDIMTHMRNKEKKQRVDFCLDRVGLPGVNKLMPSELSGGMKKRVALARAIVNKPKYLFCDEPNSGLDPQNSVRIDKLIQEMTQEYQITTLVITHDMNSVMEIGDHIIFLHEGRKEWEGNDKNILQTKSTLLRDFMLSNKLIRRFTTSDLPPQKQAS